jgi:hypothetical protein
MHDFKSVILTSVFPPTLIPRKSATYLTQTPYFDTVPERRLRGAGRA